jgi:hypothetical protein
VCEKEEEMNKLIWEPGIPSKPGMYWYSVNLSKNDNLHPFVLQMRPHSTKGIYGWCFGRHGNGPLEMFYNKAIANCATHAEIPKSENWIEASAIKGDHNYCWFKDTKGHYGFGIISAGWGGHHYVTGDWIWVNHKTSASEHGTDVQWKDGWLFSLVEVPIVGE